MVVFRGLRARPAALLLGLACAALAQATPSDPYPSTYQAATVAPVLIQGATVLTGTGERLDNTDILLKDGVIAAIGPHLTAPDGAQIVDARGRTVTPGIIDIHSHLGVYPSPAVSSLQDGNEMTAPVTANVWAEHSIWPVDPASRRPSRAASHRSRYCPAPPTSSADAASWSRTSRP